MQAQSEVPKQHFLLPHPVARPACFPDSATAQAVSIQEDTGQIALGDGASTFPAPEEPASQRRGTQQVALLSRHPVLKSTVKLLGERD